MGLALKLLALLIAIPSICLAATEDVTVSWDPQSEPDLLSFQLYHSRTSNVFGSAPIQRIHGYLTTTQVLDLPNGTHYFTLSACDTSGNESEKAAQVSVTVSGSPWTNNPTPNGLTGCGWNDTSAPSQITGVQVSPSTSSAQLLWNKPTDNSDFVALTTIERCTGSGCNPSTAVATVTGDKTAYTSTGLSPSTTYGFQLQATDGPGNIGQASAIVYATTPAFTGTGLTITSNGKFAIAGVPKFLIGVSYYDGINYHTTDLDALSAKGINLLRVFCDRRPNAISCLNSNGTLKPAAETALNGLIGYAATKGMIVELVALHADIDGDNSMAYLGTLTTMQTALTNIINAFKTHTNLMFDITQSHNRGVCCDAHGATEMLALMNTARAACASCVIFYSSDDTLSAHSFTTTTGSVANEAELSGELADGVNAIAIHTNRTAGWHLLGGARATSLRNYMDSAGRQSIPCYFQESAREGSGGTGVAADYVNYAAAVKAGGCAAYSFLTDAGYDMSVSTFMSQLDPVESAVIDGVASAVANATGLTRDTALFTDGCTGTGADLGASWDAGYTGRSAWQKVSDRCRTAGSGVHSVESYNGAVQASTWIEFDTPTLNKTGSVSMVGAGFYQAPGALTGYECRFGNIPGSSIRIVRLNAGTEVELTNVTTTAVAATGKKACERRGTNYFALLNGVIVASAYDATLTGSLRPGIYGYSDASGSDIELDNIAIGNFTSAVEAQPKITGLTVDSTGADITYTGSLASIRVSSELGDVIYTLAQIPGGRLTRQPVAPETFWCVIARDSAGVENTNPADYQCRPVTPVADTTAPTLSNGQPSGTLAAGTTSTVLSWSTNEAATCKLGTSDVAYASLPLTATNTGGVSHSYTATGLSNGASYTYYPECQDASLNASATTFAITFSVASVMSDTTAPTTVTGLSCLPVSSTQAACSWNPSTDANGIAVYRIYRCPTQDCATRTIQATTNNISTTLAGLTPHATYWQAASALDPSGNESALGTVITLEMPGIGDIDPPTADTSLGYAGATYQSVSLVMSGATDNLAVAGRRVERCRVIDGPCTVFHVVGTTPTNGYTDPTVVTGETYVYRTIPYDAAGNVSIGYSPTFTIQVPDVPDGITLGICPCKPVAP